MQNMRMLKKEKAVTLNDKREKEKTTVTKMIQIYCRGKRHSNHDLCRECKELISYSCMKIDNCPFMDTKSFCSNCEVSCYKNEMREKIRKVMRYSGPRMLLYDPILAIQHLLRKKSV